MKLTIGNIKRELRHKASFISTFYPEYLWSDLVRGELLDVERKCQDRMSEGVFDQMHEYGMEKVHAASLVKKVAA